MGAGLALLGFVAIAVATLTPLPGRPVSAGWCLWCDNLAGVDAVSNVLLFIPFGTGLALAGVRLRRIALLALATTVTVELLQLTVVPGRDASLRDVITNTLGGIVGALLAGHLGAMLRPSRRQAMQLAAWWGGAWLAVHVAMSFAAVLEFPERGYLAQLPADPARFDRFEGRLLEASSGAHALPTSPERVSAVLGQEWRAARGVEVRATIVAPARRTDRLAPVVSITDEQQHQILVLGQLRRSVVFAVRSRAESARLRPLVVGLGNVFAGTPRSLAAPGDTVTITAEWHGERARLAASSRRGTRAVEARIGPALAWYAALPFDVSIVDLSGASLLWLFATLAPLGYWAALVRRDGPMLAGVGATLALALAVSPLAAGIAVASATEWGAAAAGVALGWLIARLTRARDRNNAQTGERT